MIRSDSYPASPALLWSGEYECDNSSRFGPNSCESPSVLHRWRSLLRRSLPRRPSPRPIAPTPKPKPKAQAGKKSAAPAARISNAPEPTYDEGTALRIAAAMLSYSTLEVRGGWPTLPPSAAKLGPGSSRSRSGAAARAAGHHRRSRARARLRRPVRRQRSPPRSSASRPVTGWRKPAPSARARSPR